MRNANKLVLWLYLVVVVVLLSGCNKLAQNENMEQRRAIYPEVEEVTGAWGNVEAEVEAVFDFLYKGGEKPSGEYMPAIELQIQERNKQRLYMDDFLKGVAKLREDIQSELEITQLPNNVEVNEEEQKPIKEEQKPEFQDEKVPDSKFIKKDANGRDYIDFGDLVVFTNELIFTYNNESWMLDMSEYKPSMSQIELEQRDYVLIYTKEVSGDELNLVYMDRKTGEGKTVVVKLNGTKIVSMQFEI